MRCEDGNEEWIKLLRKGEIVKPIIHSVLGAWMMDDSRVLCSVKMKSPVDYPISYAEIDFLLFYNFKSSS